MRPSLLAAALLLSTSAHAEPRFAARTGASCSTCHINPTGGGMRNTYGRSIFETLLLPVKAAPSEFDPTIHDKLALGADLRMAYLAQFALADNPLVETTEPPTAGLFVGLPLPATFFPMQTDIYASAELGDNATVYTDIGANGSFEAFALMHDLPGGTYVKAGYFMPPYGLKLPNHTASIRQPIGFDPTSKDAGIEIGMSQTFMDVQLALLNGQTDGAPFDGTQGKAVSSRLAFLANGKVNANVGGSVYYNTMVDEETGPAGKPIEQVSTDLRAGPFVGLGVWNLSYLGEVDVRMQADGGTPNDEGDPTKTGVLVSYQELTWQVVQGFDAQTTFEVMDRDITTRTNPSDAAYRAGLSVAWFPLPFTELNLMHRVYLAREDREEAGQHEFLAFLHFFY